MVGKRYGGQYSPGGPTKEASDVANRFRGAQIKKPGGVWLLYIAPLPLIPAIFFEITAADAGGLIAEVGAFAILMFSAWITQEGVRAAHEYDQRSVAKRPSLPRKIFGTLSAALGVGITAAYAAELGIIQGTLFGIIAGIAHFTAFGPDPMRNKGLEAHSEFERSRVFTAVEKAETTMAEMIEAAARIKDRDIQDRIERLSAAAREMFRTVEEDPRDLPRARKFLGVYLTGARDATVKYAAHITERPDPEARTEYGRLLTDLERSFRTQREALLLDNRSDLDIEIEVLRDRLKHEGLVPRDLE